MKTFQLIHGVGICGQETVAIQIDKEFTSRKQARSFAGRNRPKPPVYTRHWILVHPNGRKEQLYWNSPMPGGAKP